MPYRGYNRIPDGVDLSGEGYTWSPIQNPIQQPTVEAARLLDMPAQVTHRLIRHYDTLGVGFFRGTKVIAEVLIKAVRIAAKTLTELTKLVPAASVTLFPNETYNLLIDHWENNSKIRVILFSESSPSPVWEGDLEDIDPF